MIRRFTNLLCWLTTLVMFAAVIGLILTEGSSYSPARPAAEPS